MASLIRANFSGEGPKFPVTGLVCSNVKFNFDVILSSGTPPYILFAFSLSPTQQSNVWKPQGEETQGGGKMTIVDDRVENGRFDIVFNGPLTPQQLGQDTEDPHQLFLVRFPMMGNQQAFLDTVNKQMSFGPIPSTKDLSVLMTLARTHQRTSVHYIWSNLVIPQFYLGALQTGLLGGTELRFKEYPNNVNLPYWSATNSSTPRANPNLLSFSTTDENGSQWYMEPVQANARKIVIGVSSEAGTFAVNVFHVTSHTAKDIPWAESDK